MHLCAWQEAFCCPETKDLSIRTMCKGILRLIMEGPKPLPYFFPKEEGHSSWPSYFLSSEKINKGELLGIVWVCICLKTNAKGIEWVWIGNMSRTFHSEDVLPSWKATRAFNVSCSWQWKSAPFCFGPKMLRTLYSSKDGLGVHLRPSVATTFLWTWLLFIHSVLEWYKVWAIVGKEKWCPLRGLLGCWCHHLSISTERNEMLTYEARNRKAWWNSNFVCVILEGFHIAYGVGGVSLPALCGYCCMTIL